MSVETDVLGTTGSCVSGWFVVHGFPVTRWKSPFLKADTMVTARRRLLAKLHGVG